MFRRLREWLLGRKLIKEMSSTGVVFTPMLHIREDHFTVVCSLEQLDSMLKRFPAAVCTSGWKCTDPGYPALYTYGATKAQAAQAFTDLVDRINAGGDK